MKLDEWTDEQVDALIEMGGNNAVNFKYETNIPEDYSKPKADASSEERADFIRWYSIFLRIFFSKNDVFVHFSEFWTSVVLLRRKYELHQFVNNELPLCCHYPTSTTATHSRSSSCSSGSEKKHYKKQTTTRMHGLGNAFRYSWRREHKTTKKSNSMVTV